MKISEFIKELESFRELHGDVDIDFVNTSNSENDNELKFDKLHEGFYEDYEGKRVKTVCDIRLSEMENF